MPGRSATAAVVGGSLPLPALALAVVAIAFFALPFIGLLWRAPWGDALVAFCSHRTHSTP